MGPSSPRRVRWRARPGVPRADLRVAGRLPLRSILRRARREPSRMRPFRPFASDRRAAHSARRAVADSADEPTEGASPCATCAAT